MMWGQGAERWSVGGERFLWQVVLLVPYKERVLKDTVFGPVVSAAASSSSEWQAPADSHSLVIEQSRSLCLHKAEAQELLFFQRLCLSFVSWLGSSLSCVHFPYQPPMAGTHFFAQ